MKTRWLLVSILGATCLAVARLSAGSVVHAQTAEPMCTFETNEAHYATLTSPAEHLVIQWHQDTGAVESILWAHQFPPATTPVTWFAYEPDPGSVTQVGNYSGLDLGVTTVGYETTKYSIKGYVVPNIKLPAATFAATYEGTGTAWFVGYGTLTCK
jgi:hypothetical protein